MKFKNFQRNYTRKQSYIELGKAKMSVGKEFTKYQRQGAYHWRKVYPTNPLRRDIRTQALYNVVSKLLNTNVDTESSVGIDLGCGDGVLLYKLRRQGAKILGIDSSLTGLELARIELRKREINPEGLIHGSCYHLPINSEEVNYVLAIELIEHLSKPRSFLEEVKRVLKKGGVFICTTPRKKEGEKWDQFHIHEYEEVELREMLDNNFTKTQIYGCFPTLLDRLYMKATPLECLNKTLRVSFRIFSRIIINPFSSIITDNPNSSWNQLIAVSFKK